ncbi:hypothetical protein [Elongatibacter sediminis]|uniref:Transmembrane anchor protein n=1 Tax=Elongatibacter sediminis TaxID=3119006 RepID=A0AAW9RE94_9GAMM
MSQQENNAAPAGTGKATLIAVVVAAAILAAIILSSREEEEAAPAAESREASNSAQEAPVAAPEDDLAALIQGNIRPAKPGTFRRSDSAYRTETVSIPLPVSGEVEVKAHMKPGDTMVYSWTSPQSMYVDVHGEPYTYPDEPAVRYEEIDGVQSGHGRLTAAIEGMHGWYWLNTGEDDAVIELQVSGYFERLEEVYRSGAD